MITLKNEEIQLIASLEAKTKATIKDCLITSDSITLIVKEGDMGLAIGKNGKTIEQIKKQLGRDIHVYEHADNPEKFIANLFFPIQIIKVEINNDEAKVFINKNEKKRAIGRAGKKIKAVKEMAERHFDIKNIRIV